MKSAAVRIAIVLTAFSLTFASVRTLRAQADAIPSASPAQPTGQTEEQRGKQLIDEMVKALGGQAWLDRKDMQAKGRSATFFHNEANPYVIEYDYWQRFSGSGQPEAERLSFLTDRVTILNAIGMGLPGKFIDVVQIYTGGKGYEVTYKGRTEIPKDQVEDYNRRKNHSIEAVVNTWLKTPGVMVIYDGPSMVMRRIADKITVLSPNNDAVTIELDASTHLPLRLSFQWRNLKFNDNDEDVEEFGDYHTVQGIATPLNITRYRDGEIVSQRYFSNVAYNVGVSNDMFNPDHVVVKQKK